MKKVLPIILAVVLTAAIAVSGTVAYLTQDLDEKTNVFSVGNIDVELDEDVDVIGEGGNVTSGDDGADYTTVMPGDFLKKEVTVKNTGDNPAYVAVTVTVNNALKINNAIDEFYEAKGYTPEEIQAIYDEVFAGWGLNYTKDTDGDGTDDAGMRLTITGDDMPEHVMQVDSVKTITDYWQQYADNWFIDTDAAGAFDGYYTTGMDEYELRYTYYLYLEPDEESTLFEGLTVPAEFNADQLAMFEGLEINVEGKAIQADNIPVLGKYAGDENGKAKSAMEILNGYTEPATVVVSTEEELVNALKADEEYINVTLGDDLSYDVAAWAANGMGGSSTKSITINGNGNTLTFYQTNSDWNNVVTNNNAALVLENVNITNAGHNNGPWNRHDINFACDVSLNNVVSDKALAFKSNASLNNVTINDANTSDTYAIWIQPNGQSVSLNNVVIDMAACSDGRGIKIDEQYVGTPATVNLSVKDTKFITEEKSAILVKSKAGANITLENVDISKVDADSTNPVWVDKNSAAYADKVVVTGGSCIVEP